MQRRTWQSKAAAAQRTNGEETATAQPARRAAPQRNRGPETQEILMGIDLGSSGVRATLSPLNVLDEVVSIYNGEDATDGFGFSANGYVFDTFKDIDTAQIHKQSLEEDGRLSVPLKYALYILADAPVILKNEYYLMRMMFAEDKRNKDQLRKKLRLGLDVRFEDQYRSILAESFGWDAEQAQKISLAYEGEAVTHFLLRCTHYAEEEIAQLQPGEHRVMLLFDFGGHNMNGCQYWLNAKRGDTLNFYRMGKPFGIGSGTEHMIDYILEACEKHWSDSNQGKPLSDNARAQLMSKIRARRAHYGPGSPTARDVEQFEFFDGGENGIGGGTIRLPKAIIEKCWKKAFKPAISKVEARLAALAKNHKHRGKRHPLVVILVRCAIGVLYMELMELTIPEFLHQGAAIGLQMRQAGQEEGRADVESTKAVFPTCTIPFQAGDRLRLICDPFYGQDEVNNRGPRRKVNHQRSYILVERLPLNTCNGQCKCELDFSEGDGGAGVVMTLSISDRPQFWKWDIPLYFDNSTRCILADDQVEDSEEDAEMDEPNEDEDIEMENAA
ncbi:hypothetical protein QBC32DRAFT_317627 [Pseudoneurospora amorphoporcata]|uniref:Uncharacterized protein n=1 Tax=Pseudoneurospora amorphoporcata TaxID=241081 RepID=A0AAN6SCZ3_9PEZI|nr:hypothetical protein QBC32DRAFT_317627 [Pseudoneurospora amorphoporcata]